MGIRHIFKLKNLIWFLQLDNHHVSIFCQREDWKIYILPKRRLENRSWRQGQKVHLINCLTGGLGVTGMFSGEKFETDGTGTNESAKIKIELLKV